MFAQQFITKEVIHKHPSLIFLISFVLCLLGIGMSILVSAEFDTSAIMLAIISILLLAVFGRILPSHKSVGKVANKKVLIEQILTIYKGVIGNYMLIFLGVLCGFAIFTMLLPTSVSQTVFSSQVDQIVTLDANNVYSTENGLSILLNNLGVLVVCTIVAFLFGIRAIFFLILVWNASLVGVLLSEISKSSSLLYHSSPLLFFTLIFIAAFPHLIFEIGAYLFGAIVGERSAKIAFDKKETSLHLRRTFTTYGTLALIHLSISYLFETMFAPLLISLVIGFL